MSRRNHLDLDTELALRDELGRRLAGSKEAGFYWQDKGDTDAKVAETVSAATGKTVTVGNVSGARERFFGRLVRPPAPEVPADPVLARLEALERRVAALEGLAPLSIAGRAA